MHGSPGANRVEVNADINLQVADFGGTLGVFIGFSFITVWDGMVVLTVAGAKMKVFLPSWD